MVFWVPRTSQGTAAPFRLLELLQGPRRCLAHSDDGLEGGGQGLHCLRPVQVRPLPLATPPVIRKHSAGTQVIWPHASMCSHRTKIHPFGRFRRGREAHSPPVFTAPLLPGEHLPVYRGSAGTVTQPNPIHPKGTDPKQSQLKLLQVSIKNFPEECSLFRKLGPGSRF